MTAAIAGTAAKALMNAEEDGALAGVNESWWTVALLTSDCREGGLDEVVLQALSAPGARVNQAGMCNAVTSSRMPSCADSWPASRLPRAGLNDQARVAVTVPWACLVTGARSHAAAGGCTSGKA